jgi:D-glycero-alpha-D-manno-heptose-7-phosphate kinase
MVMTRTPLRVSFAGGGTDIAEFFEHAYGAVFSSAIANYIYVTVKRHSPLFNEPIRINYSKSEDVQEIDEIENDIVRESLRLLEIEPPIYISTVGDHPASAGLGGSSSFAVGLLHALHAFRGERVSAGQLAEEASCVEIEMLGQPIGKQDQYAAAFGGLNLFRFHPTGAVTVEPERLSDGTLRRLFEHLMLFWTGHQHEAGKVLAEQKKRILDKNRSLVQMRDQAHALHELVQNGLDIPGFGRIIDESWRLKRELASTITNDAIDDWYERALEAGAHGGKLCGAGGGGCLLFVVDHADRDSVRAELSELIEIPIAYEVHGSRVVVGE